MSGVILVGNSSHRSHYIESFIHDNNIRVYNIVRYNEGLRIAHVKELIKTIHSTYNPAEHKLIIISGNITNEAQNALLKTLEELSDGITILFETDQKDSLLPTIQSRCLLKFFPADANTTNENKDVMSLLTRVNPRQEKSDDISRSLTCAEQVFSDKEYSFKDLIFDLRQHMITSHDSRQAVMIAGLLKLLNEEFVYVENNNVNERMALENVLIRFGEA